MQTSRALAGALGSILVLSSCSDAVSPAHAPDASRPSFAAAAAAPATAVALASGIGTTLCAGAKDGGTAAGTPVVTGTCDGSPGQQFTPQPSGTITLYGGTMCLDASGGRGANGDAAIVWACNGGANQQWTLTAGTITGVNGKCLDVTGAATAPGTPVIIWTCNHGANQRWTAQRVAATPPPTPTPTPTPASGDWTFCTAAGAPCNFTGLRDVRLGAAAGPYVQQVAFDVVPCATYGFTDPNPAPGRALHCDYGPIKTTTIANPMPGMGGLGATVTVALGAPGASAPRLTAASSQPSAPKQSGSFRITCGFTAFAFNDPIAYPGQPGASHLHVFFGNTSTDANSTPARLVAGGNSSCLGGTLNRTAYWAPALVDARTGQVQTPADAAVYYKTGYNMVPAVIHAAPAGLRMIAGNKAAASLADQPYGIFWGCRDLTIDNTGSIPTTCPVGDAVRLTVIFPQCWDGVNLDAPDHKSHLAFPNYRNQPQWSSCPADHPVAIPEITEHFDYPVTAASAPAHWRLSSDMYAASSPGGFSAHSDWMNGWDPATMQTFVTQCLNRGVDCGVGLLGNGQTLY